MTETIKTSCSTSTCKNQPTRFLIFDSSQLGGLGLNPWGTSCPEHYLAYIRSHLELGDLLMVDEPLPMTYDEGISKWKVDTKTNFVGWKERMVKISVLAMT